MASSFFGLNVAYSGLNAAQASINTTANNISNVQTKGYSKQTVQLSSASSLRAYQRFGSTGTGVAVNGVTQIRDEYYDVKFRNNQAGLGLFEKKLYYMDQIQNYFTDGSFSANSQAGFSTIFGKLFNSLDSLKTSAGDSAKRNEFISNAQELCTYFNSTAQRLQELQSSVNDEIKTTVDNINSISQKIALLNKQINIIEMENGHANELRDQRAVLLDDLAKIAPIEVNERKITNSNFEDQYTGATYFTVKINGQLLIDNYEYNTLACKAREERYNQSDIEGLYDVVWSATNATFDISGHSMSGELKAMFEIRDGNNNSNLRGTITDTDARHITISSPTITDIKYMNMPNKGIIWSNNTQFAYKSFEPVRDANDNIIGYTFELEEAISTDTQAKIANRPMDVGQSVDFMGIPYYMNQMNTFLRSFTQAMNEIQMKGVDANGDQMNAFFVANKATGGEYEMKATDPMDYYFMTATSVSVATETKNNPKKFATQMKTEDGTDAHDLIDAMAKLQSKTELFRGGGADTFLQCIYADITVDAQECKIFTDNFTNIGNTIDKQRASVSGVDEDEEAMDLIKFQNAYNLSAKCISVLTEMYDQLILKTGV